MSFSDTIRGQILRRSGGRCECLRTNCGHFGRCQNAITQLHIQYGSLAGFEFNHKLSIAAGGPSTYSNGEFLCVKCHKKTRSFGVNLTR